MLNCRFSVAWKPLYVLTQAGESWDLLRGFSTTPRLPRHAACDASMASIVAIPFILSFHGKLNVGLFSQELIIFIPIPSLQCFIYSHFATSTYLQFSFSNDNWDYHFEVEVLLLRKTAHSTVHTERSGSL